jgi:hypothetical protein
LLLYAARNAQGGLRVTAATPGLVGAGVRIGMPLAEAEGVLEAHAAMLRRRGGAAPGERAGSAGPMDREAEPFRESVELKMAEPEADRAELLELARWCERFGPAPALEPGDHPEAILIDITGTAGVWHGESVLAERVCRELAERGLAARVVIAPTPLAARALARFDELLPLEPPEDPPTDLNHEGSTVTKARLDDPITGVAVGLSRRNPPPLRGRGGWGVVEREDEVPPAVSSPAGRLGSQPHPEPEPPGSSAGSRAPQPVAPRPPSPSKREGSLESLAHQGNGIDARSRPGRDRGVMGVDGWPGLLERLDEVSADRLALMPAGWRVVRAEELIPRLTSLPIEALELPPETVDLLRQLGVMRIGPLARLPAAELAARLGEPVVRRLREAVGQVGESLAPVPRADRLVAERHFEFATDHAGLIETVLGELIERVTAGLDGALGIVRLECRFPLDGGGVTAWSVESAQPTRSARRLITLVRLRLERETMPRRVIGVAVEGEIGGLLESRQTGLFDDDRQGSRDDWRDLLERLGQRIGFDRVSLVRPLDDPQPERAFELVPALDPRGGRLRGRAPGGSARRSGKRSASGGRNGRGVDDGDGLEDAAIERSFGPAGPFGETARAASERDPQARFALRERLCRLRPTRLLAQPIPLRLPADFPASGGREPGEASEELNHEGSTVTKAGLDDPTGVAVGLSRRNPPPLRGRGGWGVVEPEDEVSPAVSAPAGRLGSLPHLESEEGVRDTVLSPDHAGARPPRRNPPPLRGRGGWGVVEPEDEVPPAVSSPAGRLGSLPHLERDNFLAGELDARAIVEWLGPERIETGWFRGREVRRDYYRVTLVDGRRWWIFRERRTGGWFLHGLFD